MSKENKKESSSKETIQLTEFLNKNKKQRCMYIFLFR